MFCFFNHCINLEATVHLISNQKATKEGKALFMSVATEHGYLFLDRRQNLRHTEKILTVNANLYNYMIPSIHFPKSTLICCPVSGFNVTQVLCKTGFNAVASANREAQ